MALPHTQAVIPAAVQEPAPDPDPGTHAVAAPQIEAMPYREVTAWVPPRIAHGRAMA